jgi:hypothetical protein
VSASGRSRVPIDTSLYWAPIRPGELDDLPFYHVQLRHYPSAAAAAGAGGLARYRGRMREPLDPGGSTLERTVDEKAVFGDEGFAAWLGYGESGVVTVRRYVVYARVGAMLAIVDIDDLPAEARPPTAAMAALVTAQVACLESARWCDTVPELAELLSATRENSAATPVAQR